MTGTRLDRRFGLQALGTDVGTEVRAGVTTFMVMAYIGFFTAGFVVKPAAGPLPVGLGSFEGLPSAMFVIGFVLTAWLMARRVRGALLLGIVATTVLAIVLNGALAGGKGFAVPGA